MNKARNMKTKFLLCLFIVLLIVIFIFIENIGKSDKAEEAIVGYVIPGKISEEGWNTAHYNGVKAACDELGAKLLIREEVTEYTGECEETIRELAKAGAKMIILNSFGYGDEARKIIKEYPDISFYVNSASYSSSNVTSYFVRMYQVVYLAGVVAGMQTSSNHIGYVADIPNNEVNRDINAFALGVQSVNPDAQVDVIFTGYRDDEELEKQAVDTLISQKETDIIMYHQNQSYVEIETESTGVYFIGYDQEISGLSDNYLTAVICNWKMVYKHIIREFLKGSGNLNAHYWIGLESGAVGLAELSPIVDEETKTILDETIKKIESGKNIFSGEIYDNEGNLRCGCEETISDEILLTDFDWYVKGVEIYDN